MKIAVISDINEDITSLEKALRKIEHFKCNEIICLGDLVGYSKLYYTFDNYRDAHACLDLVRKNCKIIIAGNHDLNVARKTPEISPLFNYPEDWYNLDAFEKRKLAQEQVWLYEDDESNTSLTEEDIEFISELPESHVLKTPSSKILITHYIYPNITGSAKIFHFDYTDYTKHLDYQENLNCTTGIAGHSHPPGFEILTPYKRQSFEFGIKRKLSENVAIIGPALVKKNNSNGFLIFDISNSEIEAIRL